MFEQQKRVVILKKNSIKVDFSQLELGGIDIVTLNSREIMLFMPLTRYLSRHAIHHVIPSDEARIDGLNFSCILM